MPSLDTYAEAFPPAAIVVVAFLLGGAVFGAFERRLWAKRIEQRLALVEAVVIEAAVAAAEPLASPEAYAGEFAPEERQHIDTDPARRYGLTRQQMEQINREAIAFNMRAVWGDKGGPDEPMGRL